jgi:hypothetical protein
MSAASKRDEADAGDEPLKRLGGGRWQTRDARFTIEPASGTWSVVDAEEQDDLGMPLVRGPFRSLTDAKTAIGAARTAAAPTSPLAGRRSRSDERPVAADADAEPADREHERGAVRRSASKRDAEAAAASRTRRHAEPAVEPAPSEEPGWFRDLEPAERGRARHLIERLSADGETDAVSIVRRDLVGDVPALAAHAIERRLADLGEDADAATVVELLAEGRDEGLGVRWRIVDGDGRPIRVEPPKPGRPRS